MSQAFTSYADQRFWDCYHGLPKDIQRMADKAFEQFDQSPQHPSLHFKKVGRKQPVYSARVSLHYRALGYMLESNMYWFWIGDHKEYDKLLQSV